jgi:hypothetical protein
VILKIYTAVKVIRAGCVSEVSTLVYCMLSQTGRLRDKRATCVVCAMLEHVCSPLAATKVRLKGVWVSDMQPPPPSRPSLTVMMYNDIACRMGR